MYNEYNKDYEDAAQEYFRVFGEEFLTFVYTPEDGTKVIAEAIAAGKPHDWKNDPNYDPTAVY